MIIPFVYQAVNGAKDELHDLARVLEGLAKIIESHKSSGEDRQGWLDSRIERISQ